MTNVIDINEGRYSFACCSCKPEPEPYILLIKHIKGEAVIDALVCVECDTRVEVIKGEVQWKSKVKN